MSTDWCELLDRLLAGDPLSDAETQILTDVLDHGGSEEDAANWMRFAHVMSATLPARAEKVLTSRERLVALTVLREKQESTRLAAYRRRTAWVAGLAGAAVLAAVVGWLVLPGRYPTVKIEGDFVITRSNEIVSTTIPDRGDRIVAGRAGARVRLGGYCDLTLDSGAEIILGGEPGKEAIALETGQVRSKVTPQRGGYTVQTPIGSLRVIGTEFTTSVLRDGPPAQKHEAVAPAGEETPSGTLSGAAKRDAEAFVRQFGALQFDVRQKAVEGLVKMGPAVLPLMRKTLAETTDAEIKLRCEMVIRALGRQPDDAVPTGLHGGAKNKRARPSAPPVVVEVNVLSGVVAFSFGDEAGQLAAGESRTFPAPQIQVEEVQPADEPVKEVEEVTVPDVIPAPDEENLTANELFMRAWNSKDRDEQVRLYTRVIELEPKRAAAWQNRGFAYFCLGMNDLAIADYNKCLELDPKNAYAYNNRGQILLARGQLDEALNDLNKAIEYQPGLPYPYNHLGKLYARQGKYDLAVENFSKAIELLGDRDDKWLQVHLGRAKAYYQLKQFDKAWADVKFCREKRIDVPNDFLHDLEDASGKFDGE